MSKRIKSILFVIYVVMIFTAQTNRPDDKGQRSSGAGRPVSISHNNESRPQVQSHEQVQNHREAPQQFIGRSSPTQQPHADHFGRQQWAAPRVYAVPASAPVQNNRLFHREHHKSWKPRYNFFDNQYHFYPYVNIASTVELSGGGYSVVGPDGQNYFYDQGTFYLQDQEGQYVAVPPVIGIIVNPIADGARQIDVNGQIFYRYKGVFYVQVAQGYQVIGPVQPVSEDLS